jgi:Dam-replacing HTH domain
VIFNSPFIRNVSLIGPERVFGIMTWKTELLAIIRNHWGTGREFFLPELYKYEDDLRQLHPTNRHVQAKIRQTLQYLRDERLVEFVDDRGSYRLRVGGPRGK